MTSFLGLLLHVLAVAVQDAGAAGSRDRAAAASIECAASARTLEAEADGGGPIALRLALSPVSVGVERRRSIVQPETVIRWHRTGFRLYWRWKSRTRGGRPKIPVEIRRLIREMSLANRLWGAPRIHGELLKLGIEVAQSTVAKYMARSGRGSGADLEDLSAQPCGRHRRDGLSWSCRRSAFGCFSSWSSCGTNGDG